MPRWLNACWALVGCFSLVYFFDVWLRAEQKPFWYDEMLTIYLSRIARVDLLWAALQRQFDQNPPGFFLLTRAVHKLFGEGQFATRSPAICGFWILCLCLFWLANRAAGRMAGFIAMSLPLLTGSYPYAYEARPYGLVLGLSALALVCWEKSATALRPLRWRLSFSLCLFLACMMNWYAALIAFPFALAELIESFRGRRVNWPAWISLIAPGIPVLILLLPLLPSYTAAFRGGNFSERYPAYGTQLIQFYGMLLSPCVLILIALLLLFVLERASVFEGLRSARLSTLLELRTVLLVAGFIAMPMLGLFSAKLLHGAYIARYFLGAVIGLSLLLSLAAIASRTPVAAPAIAGLMALIIAKNCFVDFSHRARGNAAIVEDSVRLPPEMAPGRVLERHALLARTLGTNVAVAVIAPMDVPELAFYGRSLLPNLYFADISDNLYYYRLYTDFAHWCHVDYNPPLTFRTFCLWHPQFFVYGDERFLGDLSRVFAYGNVTSLEFGHAHFLARVTVKENLFR